MPPGDDECVPTLRPEQAIRQLFTQMREGVVAARGIWRDEAAFRPIPTEEYVDLRPEMVGQGRETELRLVATKRESTYWRMVQCRRADVMKTWPPATAPQKKSARVRGEILRHLSRIMPPDAPLTKEKAKTRCLGEVPGAYPEAFERAWQDFPMERKRRIGQHGRPLR